MLPLYSIPFHSIDHPLHPITTIVIQCCNPLILQTLDTHTHTHSYMYCMISMIHDPSETRDYITFHLNCTIQHEDTIPKYKSFIPILNVNVVNANINTNVVIRCVTVTFTFTYIQIHNRKEKDFHKSNRIETSFPPARQSCGRWPWGGPGRERNVRPCCQLL